MTLVLATDSNPGAATWTNVSALGSAFWGFPVLNAAQLSDSQQAIRQGITIQIADSPAVGSTISFRSTQGGTTVTETWTVVAENPPTGNFQTPAFSAGLPTANADAFLKKWGDLLADAVNNYGGRYLLGKQATMFVGPGATLQRAVQDVESYDDRMFGTVDLPANFRVVDYSLAGAGSYAYAGLTSLPATDPGYKTFGPGKTVLYASEVHVDLSSTGYQAFVWNAQAITWALWTNLV